MGSYIKFLDRQHLKGLKDMKSYVQCMVVFTVALVSIWSASVFFIGSATKGDIRCKSSNCRPKFVLVRNATPSRSLEDVVQEEQRRRQKILQDACLRLNISNSTPVDYSHLLVDDTNKIIFSFIPKVSCTTWKEVMSALSHRKFPEMKLNNAKYPLKKRGVRLETYRKVLFVREPVIRILSAYMSKFQAVMLHNNFREQLLWERLYGRAIVKRYRGLTSGHLGKGHWLKITFNEFLTYVTVLGSEIELDYTNDHWLPQHIISQPCRIKYDFIGHFENLSVEGPYVLRWLGVDHLVKFPEYHDSNAVQNLVQYYKEVPLDVLHKLGEYYDADYRIFGYSFEDTVSQLTRSFSHDYQ